MNKTLNPIVRIGNVVIDISDIVYLKYVDENKILYIKFRYDGETHIENFEEVDFRNLFTKMKNFVEANLTPVATQIMLTED